MSGTGHPVNYRADIDGLRAIAVLGVLFYHAGLGFSGGFVGVDVFFVISGFLIIRLIDKGLREERFSILDFWERRIRRIFPALFVVVVATLAVGWIVSLPGDYRDLGTSALMLQLFASNVFFWRNTGGYFDADAELLPLLHTWSLSVEEQFYVVIPLLLWLGWRMGKGRTLPWIILAVTILSFLWLVLLSTSDRSAFYLLPTRAWEMGVGGLLVFAPALTSSAWKSLLSAGGVLAILWSFIFLDRTTPFPGFVTAIPVLGAAGIILGGKGVHPGWMQRILSVRGLVFVGLISYSLYLWHWPLLAFCSYLEVASEPWFKAALLLVSLGLATLSWKYVEQPARRLGLSKSRWWVFGSAGVLASLVLGSSLLIRSSNGVPGRFSEEVLQVAVKGPHFALNMNSADVPKRIAHLGDDGLEPSFLVWGDSHAMAMIPAFEVLCSESGIAGQAILRHSARPMVNWTSRKGFDPAFDDSVMSYLRTEEARKSLRWVVLISRWWSVVHAESHLNEMKPALQLEETIRELKELSYRVVIVKQVPQWTREVMPTKKALEFDFSELSWRLRTPLMSRVEVEDLFAKQNRMIEEVSSRFEEVRVLDPVPYYCREDGTVEFNDGAHGLWMDRDHLSENGALRLTGLISFLGNQP